jgi:hypothetical protein
MTLWEMFKPKSKSSITDRPTIEEQEIWSKTDRFDLNLLLKFCRKNALSFEANFCESSGELEVKLNSPFPAECYYWKRVSDIPTLIEFWHESVREKCAQQKVEELRKEGTQS